MEDKKTNNTKLNIDPAILPEVKRTPTGEIDLEAITISIDEKNNRIIPDDIFEAYYKELPDKCINEKRSWRTSNGGRIKILGSDPADKYIHRLGANASNTTQSQRRTSREILEEIASKKANREVIERLGLEANTSNLEAMNYAQYIKAQQGDTKAAEYVRDTMGEKPTTEIQAEVTTATPEDLELMKRVAARLKNDNG